MYSHFRRNCLFCLVLSTVTLVFLLDYHITHTETNVRFFRDHPMSCPTNYTEQLSVSKCSGSYDPPALSLDPGLTITNNSEIHRVTAGDTSLPNEYISSNSTLQLARKTVLLWTGLYRNKYFEFGEGSVPFIEKCPAHESNCRTTADKSEMAEADAVVFFMFPMGAALWEQNISYRMPPRGNANQAFVFWNDEPPVYATYEKLYGLQGVFNVTVTYRLDSTIPLPVYHLDLLNETEPRFNFSDVLATKTKLVAWVISACKKSHSQRLRYVKQLQEFIPVDIYGRCGNLTLANCSGYHCFEDLQKTYKFYLAFENSICRDYITEKVYRTLNEMWIPVVLGGGNYSARLPPHSYIDVNDYSSPRALAEYLLYLSQHEEEYLKYFAYKGRYRVIRRNTKDAFCSLCGMLNNNSSVSYERDLDIHDWWQVGACVPYEDVPTFLNLE